MIPRVPTIEWANLNTEWIPDCRETSNGKDVTVIEKWRDIEETTDIVIEIGNEEWEISL